MGKPATRHGGKTAVVGGSDAYRNYLRSLGLRFDELPGTVTADDLAAYGLVICRGDTPPLEPLRPWVESGGRLGCTASPRRRWNALAASCSWIWSLQPYAGPVTRAEGDHPLLEAIAREDLYWLGKHVGIDWADTPRAARR